MIDVDDAVPSRVLAAPPQEHAMHMSPGSPGSLARDLGPAWATWNKAAAPQCARGRTSKRPLLSAGAACSGYAQGREQQEGTGVRGQRPEAQCGRRVVHAQLRVRTQVAHAHP